MQKRKMQSDLNTPRGTELLPRAGQSMSKVRQGPHHKSKLVTDDVIPGVTRMCVGVSPSSMLAAYIAQYHEFI